jgi:hypothetical protein
MRFLERFIRGQFSRTRTAAFSDAVLAANTPLFLALRCYLRANLFKPDLAAQQTPLVQITPWQERSAARAKSTRFR